MPRPKPIASASPGADHGLQILAGLLKIRERDADVRAGQWRSPEDATTFLGRRESDGWPGITIGLVGLGRIGTRVAQLLAPWRVRIVAYDPHIPPANFTSPGGIDRIIRRCSRNPT